MGRRWMGRRMYTGDGKQKMGYCKWAQDIIVSQEVYRQYWMGRKWMGRRMYTGEG
jgi:hypothetical protein